MLTRQASDHGFIDGRIHDHAGEPRSITACLSPNSRSTTMQTLGGATTIHAQFILPLVAAIKVFEDSC